MPNLAVLSVLSAASSPCPDYVNPLYEQISTAQGPAEKQAPKSIKTNSRFP
ncbi:hypothetical protein HMPREF3156_00358 [Neisseria sp. HMSC06F02]|nr:hypothetical protein HMPREF3156_00358 [Neisseria sp. HMSC06F02]